MLLSRMINFLTSTKSVSMTSDKARTHIHLRITNDYGLLVNGRVRVGPWYTCVCLCVRVRIPTKSIRYYDCTMGFMDLSNDLVYLFSSWNKQQICASLYKFKGVKMSQDE